MTNATDDAVAKNPKQNRQRASQALNRSFTSSA